MDEFKFNSQICTSIGQSRRILELGLKKETADMCWQTTTLNGDPVTYPCQDVWLNDTVITNNHFPAWSLGRLIKDLMPQSIGDLELAVGSDYAGYYEDRCNSELGMHWEYVEETPDMFNNIISTIEWLIKKGYFPKKYLV